VHSINFSYLGLLVRPVPSGRLFLAVRHNIASSCHVSHVRIFQILTDTTVDIYGAMYRMDRWLFLSWFDVNRHIFDQDMREKLDFHIFDLSDLDIWPLDPHLFPWLLLSSPLFPLRSFYGFSVSRKSEARDGRTDGRVDEPGATVNAAIEKSNRHKIDKLHLSWFVCAMVQFAGLRVTSMTLNTLRVLRIKIGNVEVSTLYFYYDSQTRHHHFIP